MSGSTYLVPLMLVIRTKASLAFLQKSATFLEWRKPGQHPTIRIKRAGRKIQLNLTNATNCSDE